MEFSRQEYWSGWPFPSAGDLPNPGLSHCRWILYHLSQTPHKPWCLLATSPAPNHCNKTPHQIPPAWDTDLRAWACHVNKAFLLYPKLLRIDSALVHRGWVLASLVIQFQTSEFPPMVINNYSKKKKKRSYCLLSPSEIADAHITDIIFSTLTQPWEVESIMRGWSQPSEAGEEGEVTCSGFHGSSEHLATLPLRGGWSCFPGDGTPRRACPVFPQRQWPRHSCHPGWGRKIHTLNSTAPPGRMQPRAGMFGLLGRRPRRLTLLS